MPATIIIGPDGKRILRGIYSRRTHEELVYKETTLWLDGSAMSAPKVDGILYVVKDSIYYALVLKYGLVDMREYFVDDGETDNADTWDSFLAYIKQQGGNKQHPIPCVFPRGRIFSSRTTDFNGVKILFIFQGGEFAYPAGVRNWQFRKSYNEHYSLQGRLSLVTLGEDKEDGMMWSNDPEFAQFLFENKVDTSQIRSAHNQTMAEIIALDPPIRVPSFDPRRYKGQAIYTTTVLRIPEIEAYGHTCGVFFWAPAIGIKNEEAPDGYDCSMSYIGYGKIKGSRGPAVCAMGPDANQISIFRLDTREGSTMGIQDSSQSGMQVLHCHSAVNEWGDYHMYCNGDWTLEGCYAEVNTKVRSVHNGHGTVLGGPLNTNVAYSGDGNTGVIRGADASFTLGSLSTRSDLTILTDNKYSSFAIHQHSRDKVDLSYDIGGESATQSLAQFTAAGATLADGRVTRTPGMAFPKGVQIGARAIGVGNGFNPEPGRKWRIGDVQQNNAYTGFNMLEWECRGAGLSPGPTYQQIEGLTVTNAKNADGSINYQNMEMSGITGYFGLNDAIILNGTTFGIVSTPQTVNGKTQFSISQPYDFKQEQIMPTVPVATFRAKGMGSGPAANRPSDANWTAAEKERNQTWEYFATDTNVKSIYTTAGYKTLTYA